MTVRFGSFLLHYLHFLPLGPYGFTAGRLGCVSFDILLHLVFTFLCISRALTLFWLCPYKSLWLYVSSLAYPLHGLFRWGIGCIIACGVSRYVGYSCDLGSSIGNRGWVASCIPGATFATRYALYIAPLWAMSWMSCALGRNSSESSRYHSPWVYRSARTCRLSMRTSKCMPSCSRVFKLRIDSLGSRSSSSSGLRFHSMPSLAIAVMSSSVDLISRVDSILILNVPSRVARCIKLYAYSSLWWNVACVCLAL